MADSVKVGTTVQLNSGGPIMTVTYLSRDDSNKCDCKWFEAGKLEQGTFPIDALTVTK